MSPESRTPATRVLYVTDREERASDLRRSIADHGEFDVETAESGDAAVERLADSSDVDCVLSDYELPESDGVELLETVRDAHPQLPFVVWTDRGSESVASRAISAGVTEYVQREAESDAGQGLADRLRAATADDSSAGETDGSSGPEDDSSDAEDGADDHEGDARAHEDDASDAEDDTSDSEQRRDPDESERERRYRTLIENLPGIVYRAAVDPAWPFEYVHGDCEQITGYSAAELRDEVDWGHEIIHEADRERVGEIVADAIDRGEPFEVTYRIRRRDGDVRWLWERGQAVSEGVLEGFITDVTEHRERERELDRARELLDDAERLAAVGAWEYDLETESVTWTDGTRRIYEVGPEFEPTYESVLEFCHPEDRERIRQLVTACRDRGESYSTQLRVITATGRERWIHAEAKPVEDDDQCGLLRGYVQDITERKRRDQQVAVLDRVLRHNLRNDMNAIVGHAEEIAAATSGSVADSAETIRSLGTSLTVLANKHREIATLVTEPQSERQFRIPEVVERPVEQLRETHPTAELSVTVRGDGVVTASTEFEEAVAELVENAIQHNDRDCPHVDVTVEAGPETLVVRIADDGPGIPDRERERIESASDVDPLYHGDGLGLWLAKWIVNRSGGTLSFEENEPRGTVVHVTVPRELGSSLAGADSQREPPESP